jgi:pimeloyl-ACP methyl ester carboxylesterase
MDEPSASQHFAPTDDGWQLDLTRTVLPSRLDRARRPVVIVPGYGMNGFIFGFHPAGTSLVLHLARAGLEVWVANLRGQGESRKRTPQAPDPSLRRYAETDLRAAIMTVLAETETRADRVDVLGASLGGSIAYAHLALEPAHHVGSVVAIGAPLRWRNASVLLRLPFRSHRIASLVRVTNTRRLAEVALPIAMRLPALLSLYLNAANVDLSAAAEMIRTVEDPHPRVNSDIAKWLAASDMILRGVNVTEALAKRHEPLLLVVANRDGIVPEASALSARDAWGGDDVSVLRVGDAKNWYAHADLFVGRDAPVRVFDPVARWLCERH